MAINKVVLGEETLLDLSNDTVTASTLAEGITAHDAAGNEVEGTLVLPGTATATTEGLVKLSDAFDSTSGVLAGVAATPAAVKIAKDAAEAAQTTAGAAQTDADTALGRMYVESAGSGYIRFSDGTQVCYGSKSVTTGSSVAALWGVTLYKATVALNLSFPNAFSATPMIALSSSGDWFGIIRSDVSTSKITNITIQGEATAATVNSKTVSFRYVAVGRWK